jgi:hypothetical protein
MYKTRSPILVGLILIALGGWLLAQNLGVQLPDLTALWPAIPILFGLNLLVRYFAGGRQDSGQVFLGVVAALVGAFFFAFTLGYLGWGQMEQYWPVFVLIGGVAFLLQWIVDPSRRGLLVPAVIALVIGFVFLAPVLGLFDSALVRQAVQYWPVALILAGLLVLVSSLSRRRNV